MNSFAKACSILLIFSACAAEKPQDEVIKEDQELSKEIRHAEWSRDAVIYEANIRQYSSEGTFNAFAKDLDRIHEMGVKIIWVMPINPIGIKNRKGGKGSYYSVRDYKAVNPEFGTLADFKALVEKAHSLEMRLIIDWVANHSAFDNVWTETHRDWYNLDSAAMLQPPAGTDWYDVADLNYDNKDMRSAMIDAMTYWVKETDIDGFRCDVADMVPIDFWQECRRKLKDVKSDIFLLAEGDNPDLHKAFDMTYAFEFLHLMEDIAKGKKLPDDIDAYMLAKRKRHSAEDYKMYFTTSHDENSWNGTVFQRFGDQAHKTFAVLAFTIDGMPMVYSGQEAGMDYSLKFFEKDEIKWSNYALQEFYTKLLQLNRSNPALYNGSYGGDFTRLTSDNSMVYAFVRTKGDNQVVTICNLSKLPIRVKFDNLPTGSFKSLFGTQKLDVIVSEGLELAPWEYFVFYK